MRRAFLFFQATVLMAATACGQTAARSDLVADNGRAAASWPIFRGDQQLTGTTSETLPGELARRWAFKTKEEIISSPVVGQGMVFCGSYDGAVFALDVETGKPRWKQQTESAFEAPPLLLDGTVYIGSLDGELLAFDAATGERRWSYQTEGKITGSVNWLTAAGGTYRLYLGSYDNRLHCIDAATGHRLWIYEITNYINGGPAVAGEALIFGGCDALLHRVGGTDGTSLAEIDVGSYAAGSPAFNQGRAYLGTYGGLLLAVDLAEEEAEKQVVWQYESEDGGAFFSSPAVTPEQVLIGGRDGCLHCVDRTTGQRQWLFRSQDDIDSSPLVTGDGKVVFGSADGRLYIVSLDSGELLWSYEIGSAVISSPAVTGGMIFIGAEDGRLYAFGEPREEEISAR